VDTIHCDAQKDSQQWVCYQDGDIMRSGANIICHQVNCRGVMGSGLAKQVKLENPQVFCEYQAKCRTYGGQMLGTALILPVDSNMLTSAYGQQYIANCFGQLSYGKGKIQTDYKALRSALEQVRTFACQHNMCSIAIPYKLGCGLAGGSWSIVWGIINDVFCGSGLNVTIWRYES